MPKTHARTPKTTPGDATIKEAPREKPAADVATPTKPELSQAEAADLYGLKNNELARQTWTQAYAQLNQSDRQFPERLKGHLPQELVNLFPMLADIYKLDGLQGVIDGQVHLIWAHPEWGNPVVARNDGGRQVVHMVSGLGGDTAKMNADVLALSRVSPNVVPMFHFELRDPAQDVAQARELIRELPPGRAFGIGEIEWARPFSDVESYRSLFTAVAEEAAGRPVVIDLHTGIISPDAVDAVRPDYGDWLTQFDSDKLKHRKADGTLDTAINSAAAHDPTPLWPVFREFAEKHPNVRFVLSHPFNPVGENQARNPAIDIALDLKNILLGSSAHRHEQVQLLEAAQQRPELFDRIVFQSDGGGTRTLVDWVEMVLQHVPREKASQVVNKTLFANMAGALEVGPTRS